MSSGEIRCTGSDPQRRLASLLPGFVACVASDAARPPPPLHPAEERYVRDAVPKRRREFAAGRACARAALERFGVRDAVLPRCADRTPLWVDGFVGSITHCTGAVAAAVARTVQVRSLGIDIELAEPLPVELRAAIATERERAKIARSTSRWPCDAFKILFSTKESFFKCHFMLARRMLEFEDVEIELDLERGRFVGSLTRGEPSLGGDLRCLSGRFCVSDRHVFSAVVLERTD